MRWVTAALVLLGVGVTAASGQDTLSLSLEAAMDRARAGHPQIAAVRAERRGREADARATLAAYLPSISTEWSLLRTDDPVAVFGSKLRQGRFAAPDLALDALNHPSPVSNAAFAVSIEQPLVAPQGWLARRASRAGVAASRLVETRAGQMAAFDALRTYFATQVAAARVEVYDTALTAAVQTLAQIRSLRREGVVTAVDEHLGLARVSELEAARAMAVAGRLTSANRLLVALGEAPGRPVRLLDPLERPTAAAVTSASRVDLEALRLAVGAEETNVRRAQSHWLPTVGAFGSLAWNQGNFGALAGPRHWTAGVAVRWSPFRGGGEWAALDRARAGRDLAKDQLAAAERSAEAEVQAAAAELEAAEAALAAAERALGHAAEASRIATVRYAGGVATISELLGVRAAESAQRLARLDALYHARLAAAALAVARGGDPQ
jgi:outer membrane protein TolC